MRTKKKEMKTKKGKKEEKGEDEDEETEEGSRGRTPSEHLFLTKEIHSASKHPLPQAEQTVFYRYLYFLKSPFYILVRRQPIPGIIQNVHSTRGSHIKLS